MTKAATIEVWRLHPDGCRVAAADPAVGGFAPESARRYCGPYVHANRAGYYLYSPVDIDITYRADDTWEWQIVGHFWSDAEVECTQMMCHHQLPAEMGQFLPRTKLFLSGPNHEPSRTVQLWTGCIFRTPADWGLWVRSPINRAEQWPFRIEEAVLETGWLQQDIWLNLHFLQVDTVAHLRRDGPPIAQIVPMPSSSYARWTAEERSFDVADPDSQAVFSWWQDYNREKFCAPTGVKKSGIYNERRRRLRQG